MVKKPAVALPSLLTCRTPFRGSRVASFRPYRRHPPRDLFMYHDSRALPELRALLCGCGDLAEVARTVCEAAVKGATATLSFTLNDWQPEVLARNFLILHAFANTLPNDLDTDALARYVGQLWYSHVLDPDVRDFWDTQLRACLELDLLNVPADSPLRVTNEATLRELRRCWRGWLAVDWSVEALLAKRDRFHQANDGADSSEVFARAASQAMDRLQEQHRGVLKRAEATRMMINHERLAATGAFTTPRRDGLTAFTRGVFVQLLAIAVASGRLVWSGSTPITTAPWPQDIVSFLFSMLEPPVKSPDPDEVVMPLDLVASAVAYGFFKDAYSTDQYLIELDVPMDEKSLSLDDSVELMLQFRPGSDTKFTLESEADMRTACGAVALLVDGVRQSMRVTSPAIIANVQVSRKQGRVHLVLHRIMGVVASKVGLFLPLPRIGRQLFDAYASGVELVTLQSLAGKYLALIFFDQAVLIPSAGPGMAPTPALECTVALAKKKEDAAQSPFDRTIPEHERDGIMTPCGISLSDAGLLVRKLSPVFTTAIFQLPFHALPDADSTVPSAAESMRVRAQGYEELGPLLKRALILPVYPAVPGQAAASRGSV
ncbi:hypothetical protein H9P43_009048 [Blastocladiella emersonii ATCC 22665]|nr:hypothetical protein H9P43_009048 [Blastocladiella emersonii ATCC 22665]